MNKSQKFKLLLLSLICTTCWSFLQTRGLGVSSSSVVKNNNKLVCDNIRKNNNFIHCNNDRRVDHHRTITTAIRSSWMEAMSINPDSKLTELPIITTFDSIHKTFADDNKSNLLLEAPPGAGKVN